MNTDDDHACPEEGRSDRQVLSSGSITAKLLTRVRRIFRDGSMKMMLFMLVLAIIGIFMLPE